MRTLAAAFLLFSVAHAPAEVIWRGDFETGDTKQWPGPPKACVTVVTEPVRAGKYAARIDVTNSAKRGNHDRIEFQHQPAPPGTAEGTERYFGWSVYLPKAFSDTHHSLGYFETRNSWTQLMAFEARGEDVKFSTRVPYKLHWTGKGKLTPGRWHDIAVHVLWSRDPEKGFVEVWFDGEKIVPLTKTATLRDENPAFLQIGMLRETSDNPESIVIDHVIEATTLAEVTPPAPNAPLVVDLWPGKPADDDAATIGPEKVIELMVQGKPYRVADRPTKWLTNVTTPTLTVYRPAKEKDTGAAVLIAPGGGYHNLGWDVEGEEIAEWLNSLGVTGIILKYRCPRRPGDEKGVPPIGPVKDAQRAVSLVRSRAKEWGIDPRRIGMVGFSAGGHLVGATCTNFEKRAYVPIDDIDKESCRPDFGIMAYSGYFKDAKTGELSRTVKAPKDAPPMFFVHATDDPISDSEHSVTFYLALKRAGVNTEMHLYETGRHGFAVRRLDLPVDDWSEVCARWMRNRGFLKKK